MPKDQLRVEKTATKGNLVISVEGDDLHVSGEGRLTRDDWKRISDELGLPNYERVYPTWPSYPYYNPWRWTTISSDSNTTWTGELGTGITIVSGA